MTKYFVIDPNGVKHTRNSDRTYTHCVLYLMDREADVASSQRAGGTAVVKSNWEYACREANPATRKYEHSESQMARIMRDAAMTLDEYRQSVVDAYMKHVENTDYTVWQLAGWCGRVDLANKLHMKTKGAKVNTLDAHI